MRAFFNVVVVVVAFVALSNMNVGLNDGVEMQASLAWAQRTIGGIIAATAGILVLLRAAQGETLPKLAPLVVAALVGILVASADWGVALALGVIVAVVAGHYWHGRQD